MSTPFFILIIVLVFSLFLVVLYKNRMLKNELISAEKLLFRLHQNEMDNAKKVADMIHDKLQGDLIAIKNFIFIYSQLKKEEDKKEIFTSLQMTIEGSISNLKKVSNVLKPPFLDKGDFLRAIEYFFDSAVKATNNQFLLQKQDSNIIIPEEKAYALFRIIEMYCDYVMSNNKAKKFVLNLKTSNEIELIDDGDFSTLSYDNESENSELFLCLLWYLKVLNGELKQLATNNGNHFVLKFN